MRRLAPLASLALLVPAALAVVACKQLENVFSRGTDRTSIPGAAHGIVITTSLAATDSSGSGFEDSFEDAAEEIVGGSNRFDLREGDTGEYSFALDLTGFEYRAGKIASDLFSDVSDAPTTEQLEEVDAALADTSIPEGEDERIEVVVGTATVRAVVTHRVSGEVVASSETSSTLVQRAPKPETQPSEEPAAETSDETSDEETGEEPEEIVEEEQGEGPSPTFRRATLDIAVAAALRALLDDLDADIVARVGDYIPDSLYLVRDPGKEDPQYRIASLQDGPDEHGTGSFLDSVTGKTFGSKEFTKSRQASVDDISTGAQVYVFWAGQSAVSKPYTARTRWNSGSHYWVRTEVIVTEELDRAGVFTAPIAGSQRSVHVTNVRIAIE